MYNNHPAFRTWIDGFWIFHLFDLCINIKFYKRGAECRKIKASKKMQNQSNEVKIILEIELNVCYTFNSERDKVNDINDQ